MKAPKELYGWDFPDTEMVPNGYNISHVPKCTDKNFRVLLENYNNLVEIVNFLTEKLNIDINE